MQMLRERVWYLVFVLGLVALILCPSQMFSQSMVHLTLKEEGASLERVLRDIQRATGYTYGIDSACLRLVGRVSFSVKGARIEEVLDSCLKEAPLYYQFIGRSINIKEGSLVRGVVV